MFVNSLLLKLCS